MILGKKSHNIENPNYCMKIKIWKIIWLKLKICQFTLLELQIFLIYATKSFNFDRIAYMLIYYFENTIVVDNLTPTVSRIQRYHYLHLVVMEVVFLCVAYKLFWCCVVFWSSFCFVFFYYSCIYEFLVQNKCIYHMSKSRKSI